ncbi:MAG: TetR family transcriptional regulator [Actinobacteria bacterium]|nr:TetR family transcriptional regulator [Actinomycetota bacterium]
MEPTAAKTAPAQPKTARQQQADDTRQRLIDAAGKLFAERGYSEASVALIGEEAGASRGLVNHHFGSKENLLWAVVEDYEMRWEHEVVVPAIAGKRGLAALRAIIDAHRRIAHKNPEGTRLLYRLMAEALDPRKGLADRFAGLHQRWRELGKRWWDEAVEDGDIDPSIDQDANASLIIGAIRGITFDWLIAPGSFDLDAAYEQQWEMLVRWLAPGS